jgi:hypothetical protein
MTGTLQITQQKCRGSLSSTLVCGGATPQIKAGDGTRTHDIVLGKHAFYH